MTLTDILPGGLNMLITLIKALNVMTLLTMSRLLMVEIAISFKTQSNAILKLYDRYSCIRVHILFDLLNSFLKKDDKMLDKASHRMRFLNSFNKFNKT